jgi:hypothetical protein
MQKKLDEAAEYYAPARNTDDDRSKLDAFSLRTKLFFVLICVLLESGCYAYLTFYYATICPISFGSNTCSFAIDKDWDHSIVNQPGVKWI